MTLHSGPFLVRDNVDSDLGRVKLPNRTFFLSSNSHVQLCSLGTYNILSHRSRLFLTHTLSTEHRVWAMDALFLPLADLVGASVDQIKVTVQCQYTHVAC